MLNDNNTSATIGEIDLNAYVDGQLDAARRIEVEEYLSHHAAEAMRVMADLRIRDALQWSLGSQGVASSAASPRTEQLTRRLEQALGRARLMVQLRRLAACLVLFALGWMGHVSFLSWAERADGVVNAAPTLVGDAVRAHQLARVRSLVASQPAGIAFDPVAIYLRTGIALPDFPANWAVEDVQVLPATHGLGIEVILRAGDQGRVSLFATHAFDRGLSETPVVRHEQDSAVVYWRHGAWAYALTGDLPVAELDRMANGLVMLNLAS